MGGEWVGASKTNHPDFFWLPTRAISGNPHISLEEVREMVKESRGEVSDGTGYKSFTNTNRIAIPDNDPVGATSAKKPMAGKTTLSSPPSLWTDSLVHRSPETGL